MEWSARELMGSDHITSALDSFADFLSTRFDGEQKILILTTHYISSPTLTSPII